MDKRLFKDINETLKTLPLTIKIILAILVFIVIYISISDFVLGGFGIFLPEVLMILTYFMFFIICLFFWIGFDTTNKIIRVINYMKNDDDVNVI